MAMAKQKNMCVFPISWSSKLGSVGRDFFFFFKLFSNFSKDVESFESSDFWRVVALLFPYGKNCWRPFHYRIAESLILVPPGNRDEFPNFADPFSFLA